MLLQEVQSLELAGYPVCIQYGRALRVPCCVCQERAYRYLSFIKV